MKTKLRNLILTGAVITALMGCAKTKETSNANSLFALAALNRPNLISAPSGSDLLSTTTNLSEKLADPETKASGLAGAAYIKPPKPDHYGAVSFSYPLEIPAGRKGMGANIGLRYSSQAGDGWVGIGWSLGMGAITRTTRYGPLHYDHRDVFVYKGRRLIKVAGPAGTSNGTYRTEIEGKFLRLELSDVENGGTWRVFNSAGVEMVYGESRESRIYHPDDARKTYSWYFCTSVDGNSNRVRVVYDTSFYAEKNVLYLKEIRYTSNDKTGASARQYVRFETKARADKYVSKAGEFSMTMDRLLDRIVVGWDKGELWDYKLIYELSEDSKRPLLKTVASSRTTTRPEFSYKGTERRMTWRKVPNPDAGDSEVNPQDTKYFEGDFNGDGISDMVFFNPETGLWKAAEGTRTGTYAFKPYGKRYQGYSGPDKIQFFKGNVSGDYNGDGRSDIAFYLPETRQFVVAQHNGTVLQFFTYGQLFIEDLDIFKCEWFQGDYNGDGMTDIVLFEEKTGSWIFMRNTGDKFEFIKFSTHFKNLFRSDYEPNFNLDSPTTLDNSAQGGARSKVRFFRGDYNGNGRTDIAVYDSRSGHWYVGENKFSDPLGFRLEWKLYRVFTAPEQALFGMSPFSGDYNGDGLDDFLMFDRSTGEWTLGETQPGSIRFRIISRTPQYKDITRWLRGDFNGDGRTDIGFYSQSDNNFWIGEAEPGRFRYRIYTDLSNGPDAKRILETPLARDQVILQKGKTVYGGVGQTHSVDYMYDANPDKGELVFPGCFSAVCGGELLVYSKGEKKLSLRKVDGSVQDLGTLDLESERHLILKDWKQDDLLYYEKGLAGTQEKAHNFKLLTSANPVLAAFDMADFDPARSAYVIGNFKTGVDASLLVLEETGARLVSGALSPDSVSLSHPDPSVFKAENRAFISLFTGRFLPGSLDQVLLVDRRAKVHKWYQGTLASDSSALNFVEINSSELLPMPAEFDVLKSAAGFPYRLKGASGSQKIVFALQNGETVIFRELGLSGSGSVSLTLTTKSTTGAFKNEWTHAGYPVLHRANGADQYFDLDQSKLFELKGSAFRTHELKREDLLTKVYPFRWIQGDYNGDGKTDLGIFHLKEPVWYFANSIGVTPDLIQKVENGIGGSFELEYINSTSLDNTGGDYIPDLPMNQVLVSKLIQNDGLGYNLTYNYEYSGGYRFSQYVDGRKETDFFGFSNFVTRDAYNARRVETYHNIQFENYLANRALAGAIKESVFIGRDNKQYQRTIHDYLLDQINTGSQTRSSWLVTPARIRKYFSGELTVTESKLVKTDGYRLLSISGSTTDHYQDTAHPSVTRRSYSEFEVDPLNNQQRLRVSIELQGSQHETTRRYDYDSRGNRIKSVRTYTGSGLQSPAPLVQETEYDGFGNPVLILDKSGPETRKKAQKFDPELNQYLVEESNFTGKLDLRTRYGINYGSAFGKVEQKEDPNGARSYWDFDAYGRMIRARADLGGSVVTLQTYSYDHNFPLSARTDFQTGTDDPLVSYRSYLDGMGRLIHRVRSAGEGRYERSGRIVYDGVGRVIRTSRSNWADAAEIDVFRVNLTEREPTLTEYDASGRVGLITTPRAAGEDRATSITTTYKDPWEVITTHSIGRSKRVIRNARRHVLYVEDSGLDSRNNLTRSRMGFCYNLADKRFKKMDLNSMSPGCAGGNTSVPPKDRSGNNITWFSYDGFGRKTGLSDPDMGVTRMTYDAFGDMISRTDARGLTTNLRYDRQGRMVHKTLPANEGQVYYVYDRHTGAENGMGRLVAMDDPAQAKTLSYDKLGRVKVESRRIKEHSSPEQTDVLYVTRSKHDLLNRIVDMDYPNLPDGTSGMRTCYSYNSFGYTNSIRVRLKQNSGSGCGFERSIIAATGYNEFGQVETVSYGNGVQANYSYDVKNRLRHMLTTSTINGEVKKLQDINYTFNVQDSITRALNQASDYKTEYDYVYDGLNRLVDARGEHLEPGGTGTEINKSYHRGYEYGSNGNLLAKVFYNTGNGQVEDRWSYAYENHMVGSINSSKTGGQRFQMRYDNLGNMVFKRDSTRRAQRQAKEVVFNSQNRISRIRNPDQANDVIGQYWYDDQGFRVRKLAKAGVSFIGNPRFHRETLYPSKYFGLQRGAELKAVNNVYLNGKRIAAVEPSGTGAWFLTDQVDSVSLVLGGDGALLSRNEYYPYGQNFVRKGDKGFIPKFNSQEKDTESGYYFYNARHYDPQISRFITADTVIDGALDTQGWNRFAYVKGNPINFRDPTGHSIMGAAKRRFKAWARRKGLMKDAVTEASGWQGSDDYPGVDEWEAHTLQVGEEVLIGEPHITGFAAHPSVLRYTGAIRDVFWGRVQVEKNLQHGYRGIVGHYRVTEDIDVARSHAKANTKSRGGSGGLQYYIQDVNELIAEGVLVREDETKLLP